MCVYIDPQNIQFQLKKKTKQNWKSINERGEKQASLVSLNGATIAEEQRTNQK